MPVYRYQVVSVGMWRGKIKRWNTVFHDQNVDATSTLYGHLQRMGYPNPGDATGACSGGIASINVYDETGGAPISVTTYFDWETPSTWVPFTGEDWFGIPEGTPVDASGESALVIVGMLPGLSVSGKPMSTRKYLHQVPSRTETDYTMPDINENSLTALSNELTPGWMRSPSGVAPTTVAALPYYGNHQRVRGRRRTTTQVVQQSYAAGVSVGAGASTGGGLVPFREEQAR